PTVIKLAVNAGTAHTIIIRGSKGAGVTPGAGNLAVRHSHCPLPLRPTRIHAGYICGRPDHLHAQTSCTGKRPVHTGCHSSRLLSPGHAPVIVPGIDDHNRYV